MEHKTLFIAPLMLISAVDATTLDAALVIENQDTQSATLTGIQLGDVVIGEEKLQEGANSLGEALSRELGFHANSFGGGASSPIIRGQEGVRLKILQNNNEVTDVSDLSPDHNHGVDALLASRIEVIRGASTLLYGGASPSGVINVIDERIPTNIYQRPELIGKFRYNANNNEHARTFSAAVSTGNISWRLSHFDRSADNYRVPAFNLEKPLNFVPDTHAKTTANQFGSSLVLDNITVGTSITHRTERYGIPGHNHNYDSYNINDMVEAGSDERKFYIGRYPHLYDDHDLHAPHFHGGAKKGESHQHSHANPFGFAYRSDLGGPNVVSDSLRFDTLVKMDDTIPLIKNITLRTAHTNYHHDERDDEIKVNLFDSRAHNLRLEIMPSPWGNLETLFGYAYGHKFSQANVPQIKDCSNSAIHSCHQTGKRDPSKITEHDRKKWALYPHLATTHSLFSQALFKVNDNLSLNAAYRFERQRIHMDYDVAELLEEQHKHRSCSRDSFLHDYSETKCENNIKQNKFALPDLSDNVQDAHSLALSSRINLGNWELNATYSHNERNPSPRELYWFGSHIPTNSFELGNKHLTKEISNNVDFNAAYYGDNFSIEGSFYYYHFLNRIFLQTLTREQQLRMNRSMQSKAHYLGLEGRVNYALNNNVDLSAFADWVKGDLYDIPDLKYRNPVTNEAAAVIPVPDTPAPRTPPARIGLEGEYRFNLGKVAFSARASYIYTFAQNRVAQFPTFKPADSEVKNALTVGEDPSSGNHMLNFYLKSQYKVAGLDLNVSLNAQNLLDQAVYQHASFLPYVPQMGRNFTINVEMKY